MMKRDSAFFARSMTVAQNFLQTAVVVDDRAFTPEPETKPTGPLTPPRTPSTTEPREEGAIDAPVEAAPEKETTIVHEAHRFEPQPVIDGFARRGIVCAVLQRDPNDTLKDPASRLSQLSRVADVLVLDWHVHADGMESAEETLELLEGVAARNRDESPRQLRLMVVYTGETNLLKVANLIRARLEGLGDVRSDGDFAFTQGAVRIVVLGKKTIAGRSPEAKAQEADFDELAARTVSEFTAMTAGLVSNVVLNALALLRCATHRILGRFPASLDAAFLVHRALLDPPQDADEHLAPIIAAELQAVIEDVGEPIARQIVGEWLDAREPAASTYAASGFESAAAERDWLLKLCDNGYKDVQGALPEPLRGLQEISGGYGCQALDQLIGLINGGALPSADEELAMLMAVKTKYSSDPPMLTLGTIVLQQKENARVFWLCLQPVCDAIRLSNARGFPMLRLSLSPANQRFGLVVKVDEAFVRLRIDPRPFKVRTIEFTPDRDVKAVIGNVDEHQQYWFSSKDPEFRCRWIAELKFEQAQRAVQALANQNSRVGLTESEWQRRWDRQRGDG